MAFTALEVPRQRLTLAGLPLYDAWLLAAAWLAPLAALALIAIQFLIRKEDAWLTARRVAPIAVLALVADAGLIRDRLDVRLPDAIVAPGAADGVAGPPGVATAAASGVARGSGVRRRGAGDDDVVCGGDGELSRAARSGGCPHGSRPCARSAWPRSCARWSGHGPAGSCPRRLPVSCAPSSTTRAGAFHRTSGCWSRPFCRRLRCLRSARLPAGRSVFMPGALKTRADHTLVMQRLERQRVPVAVFRRPAYDDLARRIPRARCLRSSFHGDGALVTRRRGRDRSAHGHEAVGEHRREDGMAVF